MKKLITASIFVSTISLSAMAAAWSQPLTVKEVWIGSTNYVVGFLKSDSSVRFKCTVNGDADLIKSTIATALTAKVSTSDARFYITSWTGGCQMNGILISE